MSTLSIGRVGLDLSLDPSSMRVTGAGDRTVVIAGEIAPTSAAEATSLRNELYRMSEIEDMIVPVTFSPDPTINGYYRLVSVMVDIVETSLSGWYPFSVTLDRAGSDGRIGIQARTNGGLRSNEHGITTGTYEPLSCAPPGFFAHDHGGLVWGSFNRATPDGNVKCWYIGDFDIDPIYSLAASDYYNGAAQIEVGSTLRVLAGLDCENEPADWRLSNGLVRVSPNATLPERWDISIYPGYGSVWDAAKTYKFLVNGTEVDAWDSVSVIKNGPEVVVIRLLNGISNRLTVDITLKRGHRNVEFRVNRDAGATFKIMRATNEAGTAFTGGVRATSNDADGNRYVIGTSETPNATDTTAGGLQSDSQQTWDFFISSELHGSGAAAPDDATSLVAQYHGYVSEVLSLVVR